MTTLLAFLLTLGVLIVVHEYGHYRVAVACGVRVLRFSVGFGRVLWRWQRTPASTEFVVCALPLGGYVKMLDEREGPVAPGERTAAFGAQPLSRRAAIVVAGPLANLGLAVFLYAGANWIGVDEPKAVLGPPVVSSPAERAGLRAGDWVRALAPAEAEGPDAPWREVASMTDLRWQLTRAVLAGRSVQLQVSDGDGRGARSVLLDLAGVRPGDVDAALMRRIGIGAPFSEAVMGRIQPGGPAERAGLQPGDRVLEVDGRGVAEAQTLREIIRAGPTVEQRWLVERQGRMLTLAVVPRNASEGEVTIGRIDAVVGARPEMVTVRHGPLEGLALGLERTWEVSVLTLEMFGRMLVGESSLKNLSGPLTIADYAGQSVEQGLAFYLGFLALVSVGLGVLNLLPLPLLDGGHLMVYIVEGLARRPVPEVWLGRLQRVGFVLLLMMMTVALFNDVVRLLGLH